MKKMSLFGFFALALLAARPLPAAEGISLASLEPLRNAAAPSTLDGRVLLYFWASWCPECREKLSGELAKLAAENPGVKVVTVNADRAVEKAEEFADNAKLSLPIYRDHDRALAKGLKVFSVPSWALVRHDQGGWILQASSSGADLAEIKKAMGR